MTHRYSKALLPAVLMLLAVLTGSVAQAYFAADFEQRFFFEKEKLVTDHSLVQVTGDGFHLFYTIGKSGEGWQFPDNMVDFGHASSPDLIHWTVHPRVLSIQQGTWKDRNLWAPQVIEDPPNGYIMYYAGVDSFVVQAIGIARSTDLENWIDESIAEPAYHPDPAWAAWQPGVWSNGRDPFAWRVGGGTLLITSATASAEFTGSTERGALSFAESPDGESFTDLGAPLFVNDTSRVLESSSLYRRPNLYFLFYHETNVPGVRYMTSPQLLSGWDKASEQVLDPFAFGPGEVVVSGPTTLFSRVIDVVDAGTVVYGAKFDTLQWGGSTAGYGQQNTLWEQWSVVEGDAFDFQPVFGDLPAARGDAPSNFEGAFWINTSETYNGPLGLQDAGAPAADSLTGRLRSQVFVVSGEHINLSVGGGNDPDSLYVALVDADTDQILDRSTGGGSNQLWLRHWDLSGLLGRAVYIEIADLRSAGPLGYIAVDDIREGPGAGVGVGDQGAAPPAVGWRLGVPFPNPLPAGGMRRVPVVLDRAGRVRLAVYDVQGRLQRLLHDGPLGGGSHLIGWDGRDAGGRPLGAGIYLMRLDAGGDVQARKVMIGR